MKRSRLLGVAALLVAGTVLLGAMPGCAAQQGRGLEGQGLTQELTAQGCVVTEFCFENSDGVNPQDLFDNRTAPIGFAVGTCGTGQPQDGLVFAYLDAAGQVQIVPARWGRIENEQGQIEEVVLTARLDGEETAVATVRLSHPRSEDELAAAGDGQLLADGVSYRVVAPAAPAEGITVACLPVDSACAASVLQMVRRAVSVAGQAAAASAETPPPTAVPTPVAMPALEAGQTVVISQPLPLESGQTIIVDGGDYRAEIRQGEELAQRIGEAGRNWQLFSEDNRVVFLVHRQSGALLLTTVPNQAQFDGQTMTLTNPENPQEKTLVLLSLEKNLSSHVDSAFFFRDQEGKIKAGIILTNISQMGAQRNNLIQLADGSFLWVVDPSFSEDQIPAGFQLQTSPRPGTSPLLLVHEEGEFFAQTPIGIANPSIRFAGPLAEMSMVPYPSSQFTEGLAQQIGTRNLSLGVLNGTPIVFTQAADLSTSRLPEDDQPRMVVGFFNVLAGQWFATAEPVQEIVFNPSEIPPSTTIIRNIEDGQEIFVTDENGVLTRIKIIGLQIDPTMSQTEQEGQARLIAAQIRWIFNCCSQDHRLTVLNGQTSEGYQTTIITPETPFVFEFSRGNQFIKRNLGNGVMPAAVAHSSRYSTAYYLDDNGAYHILIETISTDQKTLRTQFVASTVALTFNWGNPVVRAVHFETYPYLAVDFRRTLLQQIPLDTIPLTSYSRFRLVPVGD